MVIKTKNLLFLALFTCLLLFSTNTVAAAAPANCSNNFLGFPTWYQYLELDAECNIVTQGKNDIPILVAMGILNIILYLAAFIATIMIFYGGFKYLTSNGDSGKITEGKNTIVAALVGLVISLIASQVVGFIAGKLA